MRLAKDYQKRLMDFVHKDLENQVNKVRLIKKGMEITFKQENYCISSIKPNEKGIWQTRLLDKTCMPTFRSRHLPVLSVFSFRGHKVIKNDGVFGNRPLFGHGFKFQ